MKIFFKDIEVFEYRRNGSYSKPVEYDYGICTFGKVGAEVKYVGQYCQETYFKIKNPAKEKDILRILKNTDWGNIVDSTTVGKLPTWRILKYLKETVPNLE